MTGASGVRVNGGTPPDLMSETEQLREVFPLSAGLDLSAIDEIVIKGRRLLRYPNSRFCDEQGHQVDITALLRQSNDDLEPLTALDFTTLTNSPQISRLWADESEWFPMLETVGFGGPGGEGKTLIAHGIATAVALGKTYLGINFNRMKAALALCEDRHDDAYLRQVDINRRFSCEMTDLAAQLLILPRRGKRNALAIYNPETGEMEPTPFFHQLLAALKVFGAKFVVLDTRSDVFRGNQNDEHQARDFVRFITDRIAEELGGVVLLLYQPSRAGRDDGSGESGSVQWDAAFRCRLVLFPAKENDDPEIRRLVRKKANFAAKGEEIVLRWHKGVFIRDVEFEAELPDYEIISAKHKAQEVFLELLDLRNSQNRPVNTSRNSTYYAPKVFFKHDRGERAKLSELEYAMEALLKKGDILNEEYGPPSDRRTRLVQALSVAHS